MRKFEKIFFHFGLRSCDYKNINFLKVNQNEFLVFRTFTEGITDLLFEKYNVDCTPCNSTPISDKVLKQGFDPKEDVNLFRSYLDKFKKI
jgi:hypothetical protein